MSDAIYSEIKFTWHMQQAYSSKCAHIVATAGQVFGIMQQRGTPRDVADLKESCGEASA